MKELLIFRIFALFPLIGTLIPDLATAFHQSFASVPTEHIIVDITLLICIAICSGGILVYESDAQLKQATEIQ